MATDENAQTPPVVVKKATYLLPAFTDKRWSDGIYNAEHNVIQSSMFIREDTLLNFDQRVEVETRSLIFQYQLRYAQKEYELVKKEFKRIEEKLKLSDVSASKHEFKKPDASVDKKSSKKPGRPAKDRTKSKSGSETDEKAASADEPDTKPGSSDKKSTKKPGRPKKVTSSGSETEKLLTSSTEDTDAPRKSGRTKPGKK